MLFFSRCCRSKEKSIFMHAHFNKSVISFKSITIYDINDKEIPFNLNKKGPDLIIELLKPKSFFSDNNKIRILVNNSLNYTNLPVLFPFDNCKLNLNSKKSVIISTMCKDYTHRLDEWILYNQKIGISGIVIFNNNENKNTISHEHTKSRGDGTFKNSEYTMSLGDLKNKWGNFLTIIDFPYSTPPGTRANNLQRNTLTLGVNAYLKKCKSIALIDADEFIYSEKTKNLNMEDFVSRYKKSIKMGSNIITNKNNDDKINNNVLDMCRYVGGKKWSKIILLCSRLNPEIFINSPHNHSSCGEMIDRKALWHYHAWCNNRCEWSPKMKKVNFLYEVIN
jgi:hypothetical protein